MKNSGLFSKVWIIPALVIFTVAFEPAFAQEGSDAKASEEAAPEITITGKEIMEKVRAHEVSETMDATFKMILKDKASNQTQERKFRVQRKGNNVLIRFLEPEDVKGTGYLIKMDDKADPQLYLYLPPPTDDYRQINLEMEGNGKGFPLLGSDFDLTDFQLKNPEDTEHKVTGTATPIPGIECYVIESTSKDPDYKYSKVVSLVRKDYYVPIKIEIYDKEGKIAKRLKVFALKTLGKRKIALKSEMTDLQNNHKTTLKLENLELDIAIPDSTFTIDNLIKP
jgi:outer membrane lipoprotein-sorting protein